MRVVLTPRARGDLRQIYAYLRSQSPEGAENVFRRIRATFLQLRDQPKIGTVVKRVGVRRLYVGKYPYVAYYRITSSKVEIVHVRHTSRDAPDENDLS